MEETLIANIYCKKSDVQFRDNDKALPIIYWLCKMYKTPTDSRFTVAPKTHITKGKYPYSCCYAKRRFDAFGGCVGDF